MRILKTVNGNWYKQKNEKPKSIPTINWSWVPGVKAKALPVPGNDLENVFLMRGYNWAKKIKASS